VEFVVPDAERVPLTMLRACSWAFEMAGAPTASRSGPVGLTLDMDVEFEGPDVEAEVFEALASLLILT
jgi:hypothetical protein